MLRDVQHKLVDAYLEDEPRQTQIVEAMKHITRG